MADVKRETRKLFWSRILREGRCDQAETVQAELLAAGLSRRETQKKLVDRFQPLDGTPTRAWTTPDSWRCGRKQLRKPPPTSDEERDEDIVWAYRHFKSDPLDAPTDTKSFWLRIAQKDPEAYYKGYVVPAQDRQERRCLEQPESDVGRAFRTGYDEGYRDGEAGEPHCYADEDDDDFDDDDD
jgi:hypothetical protein